MKNKPTSLELHNASLFRAKYYRLKGKVESFKLKYLEWLNPDRDIRMVEHFQKIIEKYEKHLSKMKEKLSLMPHIPNKNERKLIRKNKAQNKS